MFNNPMFYAYTSNGLFTWEGNDSPFNWQNAQDSNLNKNIIYNSWVNKVFNYTADELIQIMVQVYKDQKIAYPRGYSSNWRELLPKKQVPIVEGDEVEFDTKKGRKKGISELVANSDGIYIADTFLKDAFENRYFIENGKQLGVEQLKLKRIDVLEQRISTKYNTSYEHTIFSELSKEEQKEILTWMKWLYKNDTTDTIIDDVDGNVNVNYIPVSLDVDEFENLSIADKNIVKVAKKGESEEKVVKPTKYPDPFVYSNKDLVANIKDIAEYLIVVVFPKYTELRNTIDKTTSSIDYTKEAKGLMYNLSLPVEEQVNFFDKYFNDIIHILGNDWDNFGNVQNSFTYLVNNIPKTWLDFEANSLGNANGMFQNQGIKFYGFEFPRLVAEFRVTKEKQFEPNGITSRQDILNLIDEQKTKINGLHLEKNQLDDKQVFDELVQEVIRRQQELNSEEIRAGSSYMARAILFGKPNPDYIGNNMLSIFQNTDEETLKTIDVKFRPSERAIADARDRRIASSLTSKATTEKTTSKRKSKVTAPIEEVEVVEVVEVDERLATENLINDLREAMEFEDDAEQVKTQQLIDDLVEALEFM
jgi:hypothetical protein